MTSIATNWVEFCATPPFKHQIIGVEKIIANPYFLLADEMGAGKSKQAIDAGQVLSLDNRVNRVIIVTDASIRPVWFDPEFGELRKHLWPLFASRVTEYHSKMRVWENRPGEPHRMDWLVTNYDYIIDAEYDSRKRLVGGRLKELCDFANEKTMLILDESSAIKNYKAARTKACLELRRRCGRVLLLNGTPIANSPLDMFSQGNVMHPSILDCKGITQYRSRYAVMGGYVVEVVRGGRTFKMPTQILRWQNLEDLQRRFEPFVIRRLKRDCLDLPPKLPSVMLNPALKPETWRIYKQMRDEMVAWLSTGVAPTFQVIVKILRLSQITSGFLGGIESFEDIMDHTADDGSRPAWIPSLPIDFDPAALKNPDPVQEIGREKLDAFLEWLNKALVEDPTLKLFVPCRFRPELLRLLREVQKEFRHIEVAGLVGGQSEDDRHRALRLLDPRSAPEGPVVVAATIGTGAKGHNFTASHTVLNMSFDFSLEKYLQMMDRVHRPGQVHPVSYLDMVAVGPGGQKTIDHQNVKARMMKENVAEWTMSRWVQSISEE